MTQLVATPLYGRFLEFCKSARHSIKLCAPFVKAEITSHIVSAKQNGVSLNLITRINLQSFHKRASDVDALNAIESGIICKLGERR